MNRATLERLLKTADVGDLKSSACSFINIVSPTPSMHFLYNFHLWEYSERRHQPVKVAISPWSRSITTKRGRRDLPTLPMSDGESGLVWLRFLRCPCGLALAISQWFKTERNWQGYKIIFLKYNIWLTLLVKSAWINQITVELSSIHPLSVPFIRQSWGEAGTSPEWLQERGGFTLGRVPV